MATIRVCDWTKERLAKDEEAYEITIDGQTFEVGEKGKKAILGQLEGDEAPRAPQVVERVVKGGQAPQAAPAAQPIVVQEGAEHQPGPGSMPQPPMANIEDIPEDELIVIPEDTKRRLPAPTKKQTDRVLRESVVFEEGTLPSLNAGGARKTAVKKLASKESVSERDYMNQGRGGIRIGRSHLDDPRFHNE